MKKQILLLTTLASLAACNSDELPFIDQPSGSETSTTIPEAPLRTIKVMASSEGTPSTRTSLGSDGVSVVWDQNDEFTIVNPQSEGPSTTLQVTVNGQQAYGISISRTSSSTAQVRYSYIKVDVNGKDVTSEIIGDNSTYKFGINSGGTYKYAPAGTPVIADIKDNTIIPLIRVSSSSSLVSSKSTAIVTLKDVEYSTNEGSTWTKVNSNSNFKNGSSFGVSGLKDVAKTEWLQGLSVNLKLTDQPGATYGKFEGQTTSTDEIGASTLAVFPTTAYKSYSSNNVTLNIPSTQTYANGSFDHKASIMIGDVEKWEENDNYYDAKFRNMCGVLQLQLTGDYCALTDITVTDRAGKNLWGTATLSTTTLENGITTDNITGGSSTLTLDCNGVVLTAEPQSFYIVLPVGAFSSGFDVKVNAEDGSSKTFGTSNSTNTIARNVIKTMPVVNITDMELATLNLENEGVRTFLSYDAYPNWNTTSYFYPGSIFGIGKGKYYDELIKYVNYDFAMTKTITVPQGTTLTFTDKTTGKVIFANRQMSGTEYKLENMVPGHEYVYEIKTDGKTQKKGVFKTEGKVRCVNISDSWNYRDLGGWIGLQGKSIKYEWIYRGGSLNGVWQKGTNTSYSLTDVGKASNYVFSDKGRQQLKDIGIKAELDLRTTLQEESSTKSDKSHSLSLGVNNTGIPASEYDFIHIKTADALSAPLTNPAFISDVAWIIDQVVNKHHPVAFHCKSGADRTGALAMLIEALLGVNNGDIARDYELTNFSHEQKIVLGRDELRGKYIYDSNSEFIKKGFTTLGKSNNQENAYYYLNRYFPEKKGNAAAAISSADLDNFIKFMLGLDSYTHPSFAQPNGNTLESIYSK